MLCNFLSPALSPVRIWQQILSNLCHGSLTLLPSLLSLLKSETFQLKNPASFVDALPPDQLLADDDFVQNDDEDFDVDVDIIKEEDFDDIPFVAGSKFGYHHWLYLTWR